MKEPEKSLGDRDRYGSGFNQNAIRRGGVVCSIVEYSERTETPAVKAASKEAVKFLKAALARGDVPLSMLASKAK